MKILFLLAIFFAAFHYGSIWDARANPTLDVTVYLKSGEKVKGNLSRTWTGEYLIITDSASYIFNDFQFMTSPGYDPDQDEIRFIILERWRIFIPLLLVIGIGFLPSLRNKAVLSKSLHNDPTK